MKYISIINYSEILSEALLNVLDSSCLNDEEIILLNLKNKNNKDIFKQTLDRSIKNVLSNNFGKVNILIKSCKPYNNWRKELRGHALKAYTYSLIDNEIRYDKRHLDSFIMSQYKKLTKNKTQVNKIFHLAQDELDYLDIKNVIKYFVGENFISEYKSSYNILEDNNLNYIHRVNSEIVKIPEYLFSYMKFKLNEFGVIN